MCLDLSGLLSFVKRLLMRNELNECGIEQQNADSRWVIPINRR